MLEEKRNFWGQLIAFSMLVYLFFLSRRGGDTKDIISILIMIFTLIYSYKEGVSRYLFYKKEIVISIVYLTLITLSFLFSENKSNERFYIFTHMTLYSIGFMLVLLNYKLDNRYIKYIFPVLLMLSLPSVYKGIIDVFSHYDELGYYRIDGGTYTSRYQLEIGIYFLLSFFSMVYYKKKGIKFILCIYTIINFMLLLLTQSRNALIGIFITFLIIIIILNLKKGIIFFFIFSATVIFSIKYIENIKTISRINSSITSIEKIKKDARYTIYLYGIEHLKDNIIKGEGFYKYKEKTLEVSPGIYYVHLHNIFLESAITQGLVTSIAYIIFLVALFIRILKNYFKENDKLKRYIKLFVVAIYIFSVAHGMFDSIFYFEKIYQLIFTIITISFIIDDTSNIE